MRSASSPPGPETASGAAKPKPSDGLRNFATCPKEMYPRILKGKKLCIRWSPGRHKGDIWLREDSQIVCLGRVMRVHIGGWAVVHPSGVEMLRWCEHLTGCLRWLADRPLS